MAIAIQSQLRHSSRFYPLIKFHYWLFAPVRRLWWHIHAYSVILGIMILSVISVIVLYGYEQLRVLRLSWQQRLAEFPEQSPELPISIKQRQ